MGVDKINDNRTCSTDSGVYFARFAIRCVESGVVFTFEADIDPMRGWIQAQTKKPRDSAYML